MNPESKFASGFYYSEKAAEAGETTAQYNLGALYASGKIGEDKKMAGKWMKKAADNGDAAAQKWLKDNI